jgi:hypothetical protein
MSRWTRQGRELSFDGEPFVFIDRDGRRTRPVEADGAADLIVELFNREGVTPETLYDRQMGGKSARRKAGQRSREVREREYSMTYGELPPFEQFKHDVRTRIDPDRNGRVPYWPKGTTYPMELVGKHEIELAQEYGGLNEFDTSRPGYAFGFRGDEQAIYDFIRFLKEKWDEGDEEAGDLASSIMTTLGYEWI